MMRKLNYILALMTFLLSLSTVKADIVTRTRTVVDTVAAMKLINNKYVLYNAPIRSEIEIIDNQLTMNRAALRNNNDSIRNLEYLISKLEPKVKDKEVAEHLASYLENSIYKLPESEFFALCKQKDYEKAKKKGELNLFRGKENEKIVNKAKKGDFSSGLAKVCFDYLYRKAKGYTELLSAKETNLKIERTILEKKLKKEPATFSANLWLSEMPSKDVPTKVISERRERRGEDDLSYEELVAKYSLEDYRIDGFLEGITTVEGKFNGLIFDRISAFPVESKKTFDEDGDPIYRTFRLVSEKGTTPDSYLTYQNSEYGNIYIRKIKENWDNSKFKQDGIEILFGSFDRFLQRFTHYSNGEWKTNDPISVNFSYFDECISIIRKQGKKERILSFKSTSSRDCNESYSIRLLPVSADLLGIPINDIKEEQIVLKAKYFKSRTDSVVEVMLNYGIEIPLKNFYKIEVLKEFFDNTKNDGLLVAHYSNDDKKEIDVCIYEVEYIDLSIGFDRKNKFTMDAIFWNKQFEAIFNTSNFDNFLEKLLSVHS